MTHLLAHPWKQSLFLLLSLVDLVLTWWLLQHSDGSVCEANPIARWWLTRYGWGGMTLFKTGVVLLVYLLLALLAHHRPREAARVLGFGCAMMAVLVLYSSFLCWKTSAVPGDGPTAAALDRELAEWNRTAPLSLSRRLAFQQFLGEVADELAGERCSLAAAATRVAQGEAAGDSFWRKRLAIDYPNRPLAEQIAADVIWRAVLNREDDQATARRIALRLEQEFEATYGSPPPRAHRVLLSGAAQGQ
jgi:hypothetical protein